MLSREISFPVCGKVKIHNKRPVVLLVHRDAYLCEKLSNLGSIFPNALGEYSDGGFRGFRGKRDILHARTRRFRGGGDVFCEKGFSIEAEWLPAIEWRPCYEYVSNAHVAVEEAGFKN